MTRAQTSAIAALERTFGAARRVPPGGKLVYALRDAPCGAVALETDADAARGLLVYVTRDGHIIDAQRRETVLL